MVPWAGTHHREAQDAAGRGLSKIGEKNVGNKNFNAGKALIMSTTMLFFGEECSSTPPQSSRDLQR